MGDIRVSFRENRLGMAGDKGESHVLARSGTVKGKRSLDLSPGLAHSAGSHLAAAGGLVDPGMALLLEVGKKVYDRTTPNTP